MLESTPKEVHTAAARLMESGVELLRAETAVVLQRVKELSVQVLTALLATILAAAFAQVTLLIAVLYPLLSPNLSSAHLLFGLAVPAGLAVASLIVAVVAWGDVRHGKRPQKATLKTAEETANHHFVSAAGHPSRQTSLTERVTP
jgi:hypothetical protein